MSKQTKQTKLFYYVPLLDERGEKFEFDWSKVVIENPEMHINKNNQSWVTSGVFYNLKPGVKLPIFFELEEQKTYGPSGIWGDTKLKPEEKTMDNIGGFQISYPLTSINTFDKPTKKELITRERLNGIWKLSVEATKIFCEVDENERKVPETTFASYTVAKSKFDRSKDLKSWGHVMKPVYEFSKEVDKQTKKPILDKFGKPTILDTKKPEKTYIKFACFGKGPDLRCDTKVYGPGNRLVDPRKYMSFGNAFTSGIVHPVVHWNGIFWGPHGSTSSCGGSNQLRISEMNFKPNALASGYNERMLGDNDASLSDEETENTYGGFDIQNGKNPGQVNSDFKTGEDQKNIDNLLSDSNPPESTKEPKEIIEEKSDISQKPKKKNLVAKNNKK
jgi:hypothetical protein